MSDLPFIQIPSHWKLERLDHLFRVIKEPSRLDDPPVSAFIDGVVTLRSNRPDAIIKGSGQELGYKHIEKGDLVISGMNAHLGGLGISDSTGKCTPVYTVMRKTRDLDQRFISHYLWHAAQSGYIKSLVNAVRYNSADFGPETVKRFMVPVPPLDEQRQIADFLDSNISVLNKLSDLNKNLLSLNSQYLNTSIDHEFNSTGAPVMELRRVVKFSSKKKIDLLPTVSLDLVISKRGTLNVTDLPISTGETSTMMNTGDVGFGKLRPYLGKVFLAEEPTFAESEFVVMSPDKNRLWPRYLRNFLLTRKVLEELESLSVGAKMPRTSWDQISTLQIPVPPLEEQVEICDRISGLETKASQKDAYLDRMVEMIGEYKRSLVSEVVTGTFDVKSGRSVA